MKTYTIAEFKRQLPLILDSVGKGETVVLQKGRSRQSVAMLVPYMQPKTEPRQLGSLASRGRPVFRDWEIDGESLVAED